MCCIHIDPAEAQAAVGIVSLIKRTQIWDTGTEAGMPTSQEVLATGLRGKAQKRNTAKGLISDS